MRQRFAIFATFAAVILLLVIINAASYASKETEPDKEYEPDRSTYNAGATGTRALFELLNESDYDVRRWNESPLALLEEGGASAPSTFVVVGRTRIPFDEDEARAVTNWVKRGGRLVLIDRRPDPKLLPPAGDWSVSTQGRELPGAGVRPNNTEEMTAGVALARVSLPSLLTWNVDSVQPSRFAAAINVARLGAKPSSTPLPTSIVIDEGDEEYDEEDGEVEEPPPPAAPSVPKEDGPPADKPAPVAHLETHNGPLLVDYAHGKGRIIVLGDPYIVANGGLRLADNLRLAVNIVAGSRGLIVFDEYHQGRGATHNQFISYFSGTPVLWLLAQGALVVCALLWTRGRRFARPLPVSRVDRRSSLEFVASMSELQQRARAYDLALENIYTRLRRVLVRYAGLGHNSTRSEIAARVAARSEKLEAAELEALMRDCEEAINGAPLNAASSLALVGRLRQVERELGLRTRSRDARQAAEGLQRTTI